VAAYRNIPLQQRGAAVGLLSLLRNEGGSVGTSVAQTIQERREQFHLLRLNEFLDGLNPALTEYLAGLRPILTAFSGDPTAPYVLGYQLVDNKRQEQAASLAYFDVYWVSGVVAALLVPLVLLMRRSVAEKGAHLAAE